MSPAPASAECATIGRTSSFPNCPPNLRNLVSQHARARHLHLEHVINCGVLQNAEEYIHRIGRTARAGRRGSSYTFVGQWDLEAWDLIVREVGDDNLTHPNLPARWG